MTMPRAVVLFTVLAAIGIAAVTMRAGEGRHAQRIQALQFQQTRLRDEIWRQEMELARLRSPSMIRDRWARLDPDGRFAEAEDTSQGGH